MLCIGCDPLLDLVQKAMDRLLITTKQQEGVVLLLLVSAHQDGEHLFKLLLVQELNIVFDQVI